MSCMLLDAVLHCCVVVLPRSQGEVLLLREFDDAIIQLLSGANGTNSAANVAQAAPARVSLAATAFALPMSQPANIGQPAHTSIVGVKPDSTQLALSGSYAAPSAGASELAWRRATQTARDALLARHDTRLSRFYMWAQTPALVLIAVRLPTGGYGQCTSLRRADVSPERCTQH